MTSTAAYPTISNWLDNHRMNLFRNHAISSDIRKQHKKNSLQNVLADYLETQGFQIGMEYCWNRDCIYCGLDQF